MNHFDLKSMIKKKFLSQIAGTSLVLLSFLVGILENISLEIKSNGHIFYINSKLDTLWTYVGGNLATKVFNEPFAISQDWRTWDKTWKTYSQLLDTDWKHLEESISIFSYWRILIFIIGSVILLHGIFLDRKIELLKWQLEFGQKQDADKKDELPIEHTTA